MNKGITGSAGLEASGNRLATAGVLFLLLLGGGVVPACGGGGGGGTGPTDPNALLDGEYLYVRLGRDVSVPSVYSEIGILTADGAGAITYGLSYHQEEGASSSGTRPPADYDVGADRSLTWADAVGPQFHGNVGASGGYAAATTRGTGEDPILLALVARQTSVTLAQLVGTWHLVEWRRGGPDVGSALAAWGEIEVDAAGALSVPTYLYNSDGAINPVPVAFVASSLGVEAGGQVTQFVPPAGTVVKRGGLSSDGNVILLGSVVGNAVVWVLVRQGLASGPGALSGAYTGHGFDNPGATYQSLWFDASFTGAGTGNATVWSNHDGTLAGPLALTLTYGVSVDGAASIISTPVNQWAGGTGPGGAFVVLGGGFAPGSNPSISVLIR